MKRLQLPSAGGSNVRSLIQRRRNGIAAARPVPAGSGQPPVAENTDSDGMLGYWRVLARHKLAFTVITILSGVAGYFLTIPQTPVYQAAITLEIQNMNENFMNMREFDPTAVNYGADSYIQTQVRILQSETLYSRVSRKLALEQRPELAKPYGLASLWQLVNPKPLPSALTPQQVQTIMTDNLKVRGSGLTRIIEVRFDSTDPQSAADILNTLAGEFIEQNLEVRWNAAQNTGEWLNKQMEDIKSKLERSEQRLHAYALSSNLLYTSEKDSVVEQKLKQVQEELSKAQGDRVTKQSKYELASNSSAESTPEVISDSAIKDYQAKLADLRRQAAELKSSLTSANPRVKRIDAQIAELIGVLGEARAEILKRMRNEYETARRRESLLENEYSAQSKLVSAEGGKAIQYNILKREVDTTRQLYEALLQKVKEAGIASALKASNVRVVDPAKVPSFPYRPNPIQNAGLGTLAGIFLGGAFAFAREKADRTLKAPGDSPFYLNLPELGVIPAASLDGVKGLTASGPRKGSNVLSVTKVDDGEPGRSGSEYTTVNGSLELATWKRQPSLISETFRATLTSILFSSENGSTPRVIVFTSPNPGDGKTTTVSNLGIAWSGIGQRVLLIDGDMRKPRLHEVFGMTNGWGMSDLLIERNPVESYPVDALVRKTEVPGLFLLSSGRGSADIANLLYSPRMAEMLRFFRREFDCILIDTPPMLHIADARVLGRLADAVVLVLRAGKTTLDTALTARRRFTEDGTMILGTILNDWDPSAFGHGKDYYSGYKNYYANAKDN